MRALTVVPGQQNSARLDDLPEPSPTDGALLVQALAVSVCGTDIEIVNGAYGWAPPGKTRLVLGHEAVGRVLEAPADDDVTVGDVVVPIVRRPDPVPCRYCAVGEWDMCRNGRCTEHGIKELDGFAAERYLVDPQFAIRVAPPLQLLAVLVEPASVVAKAWDHAEQIGRRSTAWAPATVLVTGAGAIGLLAALMGRQRGLEVHVYDRVVDGPKPQLVRDLGATYQCGDLHVLGDFTPDVIVECTGATPVVADAITRSAPSGIVCLAGVSSGGHEITLDVGGVNRRIVLENDAMFGSVNANKSHYLAAASALAAADHEWLARVITRRVPERWPEALRRLPHDVKTVIDLDADR